MPVVLAGKPGVYRDESRAGGLPHPPAQFLIASRIAKGWELYSFPPSRPDIAKSDLFEGNPDSDFGGAKHIFSVDSDDFTLLYTCELPFLPGQSGRTGEIEFYELSGLERGGQRELDKDARLADIAASPIKKSVRFGHPETHGPGKYASAFLTLLYQYLHSRVLH